MAKVSTASLVVMGQALLLHHQLHVAHLLARLGEVERRVEHGLLGHRLGVL